MGSKNLISVGFVNEKWLKQSTYILKWDADLSEFPPEK